MIHGTAEDAEDAEEDMKMPERARRRAAQPATLDSYVVNALLRTVSLRPPRPPR